MAFAVAAKVWDGSVEEGNWGRDDRRPERARSSGAIERSLNRQRAPKDLACSMDTHIYPGKGLSLSQLVFALNKELKRVAFSPSWVEKIIPDR